MATNIIIGSIILFVIVAVFFTWKTRSKPWRVEYDSGEQKVFLATYKIVGALLSLSAFAVVAIVFSRWGDSSPPRTFSYVLGLDLLVGLASASVGGLFGFIFGIPRTVAVDVVPASTSNPTTAGNNRAVLATNTNLERVSDWLATLLIGATLVQVQEVPGWITGAAQFLASEDTFKATLPLIGTYFFATSFLGIYLITRLYLTTALASSNLSSRIEDVLNTQLTLALNSDDPAAHLTALQFLRHAPLGPGQLTAPALNATLARLLAKYIRTGKADNPASRTTELRSALIAAAADPSIKAQLKDEIADKRFGTGDDLRDAELLKLVS
ncbi:hypothetical protein CN217_26020 [Sinorhizobium meliloti]|uniref:hypothetical protein n=1 Tax=Rhizobium meliloti TaxID=382 RepID=UPI000FD60F85|nr:hypothetical protein [Sinorhizobium meliloti]RVH05452.1 hypothetical protein CN217_26020 [Sinorhizobium meliloti]